MIFNEDGLPKDMPTLDKAEPDDPAAAQERLRKRKQVTADFLKRHTIPRLQLVREPLEW